MTLPRADELIDIKNPLQRNLYTAMKHVLVTLHSASNRAEDYLDSSGWSVQTAWHYNAPGKWVRKNQEDSPVFGLAASPNQTFNYETKKMESEIRNKVNEFRWEWVSDSMYLPNQPDFAVTYQTNLHPLKAPYSPKNNLPSQLFTSIIPRERGSGNCGDRTQLLAMYLWEHSTGIQRLEGASLGSIDHEILIVNRAPNSDINNPDTWGDDAWVIDAWYRKDEKQGVIFSSKDFKQKIAEIVDYANKTDEQLIKYDVHSRPHTAAASLFSKTNFDIDVASNPYPFGKYAKPEKESEPEAYQFLSFFDLCRFKYRTDAHVNTAGLFEKLSALSDELKKLDGSVINSDTRIMKLVKRIDDVLQKKDNVALFNLLNFARHELLFSDKFFGNNQRSPMYLQLNQLLSQIDKKQALTEFKDNSVGFIEKYNTNPSSELSKNKR